MSKAVCLEFDVDALVIASVPASVGLEFLRRARACTVKRQWKGAELSRIFSPSRLCLEHFFVVPWAISGRERLRVFSSGRGCARRAIANFLRGLFHWTCGECSWRLFFTFSQASPTLSPFRSRSRSRGGRFLKGTDPKNTVEMMLTSTLPLAGQRQRAPTQEHGRSEETLRHPGRQSLWNAGQRSGGQAVSLECLSCTELGGYPSWSPMVCAADCRRARGRLS